jgi:hypothetical protein
MDKFKSLRVLMIAAALGLASCAENLPQRTVFQPTARNAFVVLEAPPLPMASNTVFRHVNLENNRFEREVLSIGYAPLGGLSRINGDSHSGIILVGHEIPPGDYALVEVSGPTFNGVAGGTAWLCMYRAAPVFHFSSGQIAIIRTNYIPGYQEHVNSRLRISDEAVLEEFSQARMHYPGIAGDPSLTQPSQVITFEHKTPSLLSFFDPTTNRMCAEPEAFSAAPLGGQGEEEVQ